VSDKVFCCSPMSMKKGEYFSPLLIIYSNYPP